MWFEGYLKFSSLSSLAIEKSSLPVHFLSLCLFTRQPLYTLSSTTSPDIFHYMNLMPAQEDMTVSNNYVQKSISPYIRLEKLGEGTFSCVYKGQHRLTGEFVALKEIKLNYGEGAPSTAIREISLLKSLNNHSNIVTLRDVVHTDTSLTIVFEYMDQDLASYIYKIVPPIIASAGIIQATIPNPLLLPFIMSTAPSGLPTSMIKSWMAQLLYGLAYCHKRKIIHRDLKPQNVLINNLGSLKLADFGLARSIGVPCSGLATTVVTLSYRAPDVLLGSNSYSTAIDVWSAGCIMAELFLGRILFYGQDDEDQLQQIYQILGTPNELIWPGVTQMPNYRPPAVVYLPKSMEEILPCAGAAAQDLLRRMLHYDPATRISAQEALNHPFLTEDSQMYTPEPTNYLPS